MEYCCPVISRTRKGEALLSGSDVPLEHPESTRIATHTSMTVRCPRTMELNRNVSQYVNKPVSPSGKPIENYITGKAGYPQNTGYPQGQNLSLFRYLIRSHFAARIFPFMAQITGERRDLVIG